MVSASFKVNVDPLVQLAQRIGDSSVREAIKNVPRERAVAALIGQAIADNFDQSGPGWAPLAIRKGKPLQKTGLLKQSVTTPGSQFNIYKVNGSTISWGTKLLYAGIHNKGGTISPKNAKALFIPLTKKAEQVGPLKNKAAQKKSGLKVGVDFAFAKSVTVPKREFLKLRPEWKKRLASYMVSRYEAIIRKALGAT